MTEYCLNRFLSLTSRDEQKQVFNRKLASRLTRHITIRAKKYDSIANDFISKNKGCLVVNLGCGFDTRYWRIDNRKCVYFDLDLPELIKIKKELGLDSGSSYNFGIKNAHELETFGSGIKVINEWSFLQNPDLRPRIYKYLGLSRTQWTITAAINENK
jgi:hypothetical protein